MKKYLFGTAVTAGVLFGAPQAADAAIDDHGSLSYGDTNSSVNDLQETLKDEGYFHGYTGSRFGPKTLSAVEEYQSDHGLSSPAGSYYGVAGPSTQDSLMGSGSSGEQVAGVSTSSNSGITSTAKQYIGTPYVWGGTSPGGFDCSGFIQHVYEQNGESTPRTVSGMYSASSKVSSPSPGDVVFFNTSGGASHAGIYVGNNEFVHSGSSTGVTTSSLDSSYWGPRYMGAGQL
ncbi:C40 family peptidase [Marinococcus luteus]|uniref:C40 family peptidase n=1 Tax=Marinococcus luteus TaxID=1122204 RepID=UPI002ACC8C3B|nr:NlpC/P60 family protein [Marinococcus luteus]MDZ5784428.1 NlpC/P60 family protein [Marinococcus luteus]